jgi:hypothetical protein
MRSLIGEYGYEMEVSVGNLLLPDAVSSTLLISKFLFIYVDYSPVLKHGPRSVTLVQVQ